MVTQVSEKGTDSIKCPALSPLLMMAGQKSFDPMHHAAWGIRNDPEAFYEVKDVNKKE
jgi:hypothetical protein